MQMSFFDFEEFNELKADVQNGADAGDTDAGIF